jgi:hypothetical protein
MNIFICYRRADTQHIARLIADRLEDAFGTESVFIDYKIPFGDDFVEFIDQRLSATDIFIVLMGAQWISITDSNGNKRLFNEGDHVRREIRTALTREGVRVVPVRVDDAPHPTPEQLPPDLERLATRNSLELHGDSYLDLSIQRLIDGLKKWQAKTDGVPATVSGRLPGTPDMTPVTMAFSGQTVSAPAQHDPRQRTISRTGLLALVIALFFVALVIGLSPQLIPSLFGGATAAPTATDTATVTPTLTNTDTPTPSLTASLTPTASETATLTLTLTATGRSIVPPQTIVTTSAPAISTPVTPVTTPCVINDGYCNRGPTCNENATTEPYCR